VFFFSCRKVRPRTQIDRGQPRLDLLTPQLAHSHPWSWRLPFSGSPLFPFFVCRRVLDGIRRATEPLRIFFLLAPSFSAPFFARVKSFGYSASYWATLVGVDVSLRIDPFFGRLVFTLPLVGVSFVVERFVVFRSLWCPVSFCSISCLRILRTVLLLSATRLLRG